ncbi:MAG TPA: amidohydrolase [Vicinamibacteria bacterium]|nr:amidohydrolase [Vicinamibacteria bacterium]
MKTRTCWNLLVGGAVWAHTAVVAAQPEEDVIRGIDALADEYAGIAQRIWDYAEVGYLETQSSELLQSTLQDAGFSVEAGAAGMPTAFVASYGSGKPIVGILAEFDALPGISQDRSPERSVLAGKSAGHACGHHLFGTGSVAAAIATKEWLERTGTTGTIRLYGTPAEEGGAGKVYMVREGLFSDVDAVLHWHAADRNSASANSSLANKSAKFRFHGLSAHASGAPERGRSALDGVEAMNNMVNMLREHVPQETRIHYVITSGGAAPNVVPDFAEVYYYVRNPDPKNVIAIFERVVKAAEGAALGTETTMGYEVIHGIYALLPNETLGRAMHANLERVGGVAYTDEERLFAEKVRESFTGDVPALSSAGEIEEFEVKEEGSGGSTDVGDVSWVVPTAGMRAATYVPGTPGHSWQAIASGGSTIGNKGMIVAAKTLTLTAIDLFEDPEIVAEAKREWQRRVGPDFVYQSLVGDRPPPLDYRKPATQ